MFHSPVHKLERNAMQCIPHQKAIRKRLDTDKYIRNKFENRRMETGGDNAGKVPKTNQRIHVFSAEPHKLTPRGFYRFHCKTYFSILPVGRKFFEGKHNRYKSVILLLI